MGTTAVFAMLPFAAAVSGGKAAAWAPLNSNSTRASGARESRIACCRFGVIPSCPVTMTFPPARSTSTGSPRSAPIALSADSTCNSSEIEAKDPGANAAGRLGDSAARTGTSTWVAPGPPALSVKGSAISLNSIHSRSRNSSRSSTGSKSVVRNVMLADASSPSAATVRTRVYSSEPVFSVVTSSVFLGLPVAPLGKGAGAQRIDPIVMRRPKQRGHWLGFGGCDDHRLRSGQPRELLPAAGAHADAARDERFALGSDNGLSQQCGGLNRRGLAELIESERTDQHRQARYNRPSGCTRMHQGTHQPYKERLIGQRLINPVKVAVQIAPRLRRRGNCAASTSWR